MTYYGIKHLLTGKLLKMDIGYRRMNLSDKKIAYYFLRVMDDTLPIWVTSDLSLAHNTADRHGTGGSYNHPEINTFGDLEVVELLIEEVKP
jgi:hypothetical protein